MKQALFAMASAPPARSPLAACSRVAPVRIFANGQHSKKEQRRKIRIRGIRLHRTLYDFRVDWRQSYYFWNQNDNVVLPIAAVGTGLSKGLTSNHDWATVRKFGSVDFTLHATNNLRFHFNYYRPSDEGNTFTTRSLDFLGSPGFWGTFARANPYYLFAPLNDYTNRFTGGFDYTLKDWSFHYSIGYQTFTENISLNNVSSPNSASIQLPVPLLNR